MSTLMTDRPSQNGHAAQTPPCSFVTLVSGILPTWRPSGRHCMPDVPRTFAMPQEEAVTLATSLNRRTLDEGCQRTTWCVVTYPTSGNGFRVLSFQIPKRLFNPADEYALPPLSIGPMTNLNARRIVRQFNKRRFKAGGPVHDWALHIKPLRPQEPPKVRTSATEELRDLYESEMARYDTIGGVS